MHHLLNSYFMVDYWAFLLLKQFSMVLVLGGDTKEMGFIPRDSIN